TPKCRMRRRSCASTKNTLQHLEPNCRDGEEVDRHRGFEVISGGRSARFATAACVGGPGILLTLVSPTSIPSFSNSPWMRGAFGVRRRGDCPGSSAGSVPGFLL